MTLKDNTLNILEEQVKINNCVGYDQYDTTWETRDKKLYIEQILDNGSTLLVDNGRKYYLGEIDGINDDGTRNTNAWFQIKYWPSDDDYRGDWDIIFLENPWDEGFYWVHGS